MGGVNCVHAFQRAGSDHVARADRYLLGGLEDYAHLAVQAFPQVVEHANRSEHHGHVAIVAAGVHDAPGFGGVVEPGALGYWECVHIGAQRDALRGLAGGVVGAGRFAANGGDDARSDEIGALIC